MKNPKFPSFPPHSTKALNTLGADVPSRNYSRTQLSDWIALAKVHKSSGIFAVVEKRYLIDGHADGVDKFDLHSRQLRRVLTVHHVIRLHVQLALLNVALLKELARDQLRHLPSKSRNDTADWIIFNQPVRV